MMRAYRDMKVFLMTASRGGRFFMIVSRERYVFSMGV
jgi:hypothetical protein